MDSNTRADHPKRQRLQAGGTAAALGLALIVVAYGIVKPPEHSLLLANEVSAAAEDGRMPTSDPRNAHHAALMPAPRVDADAGKRTIDPARECAPDQGVSESCIFN